MWSSRVDGQVLTFYLVGINNQNFIMADHQTGSWWQQVTGEAILGPLKGKTLELVHWDEVSFAIWRKEHPRAHVLDTDPRFADAYEVGLTGDEDYDPGGRGDFPLVFPKGPGDALEPETLVVGITAGDLSKAYPFEVLVAQNPVADTLGDLDLLLWVAADGVSVRAFDRDLQGTILDLFAKEEEPVLVDAQTGSEWDFSGGAIEGELIGKQLEPLTILKDYWFDWQIYHPKTRIYTGGTVPKSGRQGSRAE